MKDELVSFEIAELAKEKGFDIHTCNFYDYYFSELKQVKTGRIILCTNEDFPYNSFSDSIFAPTQNLLQKWLREKHNIHIEIKPIPFEQTYFKWIYKIGLMEISELENISRKNSYTTLAKQNKKYFDTYEEALEAGLLEALKLVKN